MNLKRKILLGFTVVTLAIGQPINAVAEQRNATTAWIAAHPASNNDVVIIMHSAMTIREPRGILDKPCAWYERTRRFEGATETPGSIIASLDEVRGTCAEGIDERMALSYFLRAANAWSTVFDHLPDPLGQGLILEALAAASRAEPRSVAHIMDATKRLRPRQVALVCSRRLNPTYLRVIEDWQRISKRSCPTHEQDQT